MQLSRLLFLAVIIQLTGCEFLSHKSNIPADVRDATIEALVNPLKQDDSVIVTVPLMNEGVKTLYTQAKAYFAGNSFNKAIASLERAHEIQPETPEITQLLAEVSLHQGNFKQAHYWANIATINGPSKGATCEKSWRILALAAEKLGYYANQEMALNKIDDCLVKIKQTY